MFFKVQGHKKDTMLFGLPSLMLKSTKKKFSSFTAYWWWSNSLHLSRFHEYSWKIVFIIFNPTARKEKNLKCLEVHVKLKRSQHYENRKLTKDAYTHMYYRDWWNSLHESLKEPVKLQYELLVNKRISCRSVAPGLKKIGMDDLGVRQIDSDRELHTGSYKQMQDWLRGYNDVASRKIQTCWVPLFYFFSHTNVTQLHIKCFIGTKWQGLIGHHQAFNCLYSVIFFRMYRIYITW